MATERSSMEERVACMMPSFLIQVTDYRIKTQTQKVLAALTGKMRHSHNVTSSSLSFFLLHKDTPLNNLHHFIRIPR